MATAMSVSLLPAAGLQQWAYEGVNFRHFSYAWQSGGLGEEMRPPTSKQLKHVLRYL